MRVSLTDAGKRFNRDWIFRHFTFTFEKNNSYAITGPNGSGKTTLLQVLSGSIDLSEGTRRWWMGDNHSPANPADSPDGLLHEQIAICAPYLEVVEEMTFEEFFVFHQHFKPLLPSVSIEEIASMMGLSTARHKQIRYYSSGMKQRVRLAQAVFSNTPLLLLDEPCTNLDSTGIELYNRLIENFCRGRLIIVSSNDETEYRFCRQKINVTDYKK